ncbi:hypothetical protein [Yersinia pseudotuberculosis]
MMDITKSQKDFEAEFRKQYAGHSHIEIMLEMHNHGTDEKPEIDYYSLAARNAWKWWQASRESIEIDLEHLGYIQIEEGVFCLDYHTVKALLTSSGIRIKGESE